MKCKEIVAVLEQLAPESLACSWDNIGLLLGRYDKEVKKVIVTLDVTDEVVEQALTWKADMIVSHHPLIFSSMKRVTTDTMNGRRIWRLAGADISYYAMHTNFDSAPRGMGWLAATRLGLVDVKPLDEAGIGMVGNLTKQITCKEFVQEVKAVFDIPAVSVYESDEYNIESEKKIQRVALCPGSGKEYIPVAIKEGAQVYITGDLGHHNGLDAREMGLTVIDASHYHMEKMFVTYMAQYLQEQLGAKIEVLEMLQCPYKTY